MRFLNHLNSRDYHSLKQIDDDWPLQFISEYSRFFKHYTRSEYRIVTDESTGAMAPIRFYKSSLFTLGQIMYPPFMEGKELNESDQQEFFGKLISYLKHQGTCTHLVQPPPFCIMGTYPEETIHCDFGTYQVNIGDRSEEEILNNFHPKYIKAIRHSVKNEARIEYGRETLDDFYELYHSTIRKTGIRAEEKNYFERLFDYLGDQRTTCAVVYENDKAVGSVFVIGTRYAALCTHAGSSGKTRLYGSMKFLNYEVMKMLRSRGVRLYDFVGARLNNNNPKLEGIFRFKRGFGGDLKKGFLWKTDIKPVSGSVYNSLVGIKRRDHNVKDIIDQVNLEQKSVVHA